MIYSIGRFLCLLYFSLFYRIKFRGTEHIPESGPVLLFANHPSTLDMFVIAYKVKRKVHYMAKAELFKNPVLASLLKKVGAFPVSRGKGDVGSVKTVFKLIEQGKIVGVFPEGTRTPKKDPGKRKAGAALMALHTGAPILPVGISGRIRMFSKVEVVFGEPFVLDQPAKGEHPSKEELMETTKLIMDRIYALIGQ